MGTSDGLNSYVAGLYGILMSVQKIRQTRPIVRQDRHYIVAVDSQNALRSLLSPKHQSGQYVVSQILKEMEIFTESNTFISYRWMPAHEGVMGNERAHTLASQTTEKNGSDRIRAPMAGLKRLKSALIRGGRKRIQAEWTPHFEKNQTVGASTRKLDGALPQRHTLKLYSSLTTQESPTFIQLRTDHNRLR